MTDHKLTDEEIIYVFERCASDKTCAGCPVKDKCDNDIHFIDKCILDVVKRQRAMPLQTYITTAKTVAIKDFAERLCADRVSNDPVVIAVKGELKAEFEVPRHLSGSERNVYLLGEWGKDKQH